jgi:hypothetical protein
MAHWPTDLSSHTLIGKFTRPHIIAGKQEVVDHGAQGFDRFCRSRLSATRCLLEVCSLQRLQSGDESVRVLLSPTQPFHIFAEAE